MTPPPYPGPISETTQSVMYSRCASEKSVLVLRPKPLPTSQTNHCPEGNEKGYIPYILVISHNWRGVWGPSPRIFWKFTLEMVHSGPFMRQLYDNLSVCASNRSRNRYTGGMRLSILAHIRKPIVCHGRARFLNKIGTKVSGTGVTDISMCSMFSMLTCYVAHCMNGEYAKF